MEPGNQYQYGQHEYGASGDWDSAAGTTPETPVPTQRRGRTSVVLFTAFFVELVIIAAVANQWVVNKIARSHPDVRTFADAALRSIGEYRWRVTKPPSVSGHMVASDYAMVGGALIATVLLLTAIVRGPITWGRAFFGTWLAVVAASVIGAYARSAVYETALPRTGSHLVTRIVFGSLAPSAELVFAAIVLGFVVALVTSIVAIASRKSVPIPGAVVPVAEPTTAYDTSTHDEPRPAWGGDYAPARPAETYGSDPYASQTQAIDAYPAAYPARSAGDEQPGDDQPGGEQPGDATSRLPRVDPHDPNVAEPSRASDGGPDQPTGALAAHDEPTSALPAHDQPGNGDHNDDTPPTGTEPAASGSDETPAQRHGPFAHQPQSYRPNDATTPDSADQRPDPFGTGEPLEPGENVRQYQRPQLWNQPSAPQWSGPARSPAGEQGTTDQTRQFPRPPDDEDLNPEHD